MKQDQREKVTKEVWAIIDRLPQRAAIREGDARHWVDAVVGIRLTTEPAVMAEVASFVKREFPGLFEECDAADEAASEGNREGQEESRHVPRFEQA